MSNRTAGQSLLIKDLNRAQAVALIGSWRLDTKNNILRWSDQTYRMFGIPIGTAMTYETFLSKVHPQDRSYVNKKWNEALRGNHYDIEHRIIVGKKILWVREKAELEFNTKKELVGGFGTVQDITKEKRKDEEIERLSRFPLENPSPIIRIDKNGRIIFANKAANPILNSWKSKIGEEIPKDFIKCTNSIFSEGKRKEFEIKVSKHYFLLILVPIKKGNYINLYGFDITRRKKLEQEKDEFISIASHELKTPLANIKVFIQLLQKKCRGTCHPLIGHFLKRLVYQVDSLTHLVNDLLDTTKIQAGKLILAKNRFNLDDLIEEIISDINITIADKHQIIFSRKSFTEVFADRYRIGQVLLNLLTNAIDYSPENSEIIVAATQKKNKIIVSVKDFGLGIPKEGRLRVFERFYRAHPYRESLGKLSSLGLGLYISSEIIKNHNESIWLESKEGKGSTFYFTLSPKPLS